MNINHPNAQICSCANRACNGVGNIVKFEIQEHVEPQFMKCREDGWTLARKQLFTYLHTNNFWVQQLGAGNSLVKCREVERDNQRASHNILLKQS